MKSNYRRAGISYRDRLRQVKNEDSEGSFFEKLCTKRHEEAMATDQALARQASRLTDERADEAAAHTHSHTHMDFQDLHPGEWYRSRRGWVDARERRWRIQMAGGP